LYAEGWDFYAGVSLYTPQYTGWSKLERDEDTRYINNPIGNFGIEYVKNDKKLFCEHLSSISDNGKEDRGFNHCGFLLYLNK
jgi:hypothetical protein